VWSGSSRWLFGRMSIAMNCCSSRLLNVFCFAPNILYLPLYSCSHSSYPNTYSLLVVQVLLPGLLLAREPKSSFSSRSVSQSAPAVMGNCTSTLDRHIKAYDSNPPIKRSKTTVKISERNAISYFSVSWRSIPGSMFGAEEI
jgi:hypothetical protein